ncbi:MAG: VanZ family protein [Candidatus Kapaibacterium sp.]
MSGLIFVASAQEQAPMPDLGFTWQDKAYHFFAYMAYAATVHRAVSAYALTPMRVALVVIGLSAAYAATDEWHQTWVPGRSSEVADWIADVCGATVTAVVLTIRTMHTGRST